MRRWAGKFELRRGLLRNVLRVMEIGGLTMSDIEKLCVISFDEVKVKETVEYDEKEEEVVGPHKQLQVVMVRSLYGKWKQPIWVAFDQSMTRTILFDIINDLHKIGFTTVSCVCDGGGSNQSLWNELGINFEKPFFQHPSLEQPVVLIPDAHVKVIKKLVVGLWFYTGRWNCCKSKAVGSSVEFNIN